MSISSFISFHFSLRSLKRISPLVFFILLSNLVMSQQSGSNIFRYNASLEVDGLSRLYVLNLPSDYYEKADFSLIIALHGGGGSAKQAEESYQLTQKSNAEHTIIVYPEGVQSDGVLKLRTWNAGTCCQYAVEKQIDDVHFISTLIDELISKYKINPKRVYVTGMSNGAMLAYRLSCEIPEKIAAIAAVSGTLEKVEPCISTLQVPILHLHSELDKHVPYRGGKGIRGYYFHSVDYGLTTWAKINGCIAPPAVIEKENYTLTQWKNAMGKVVIEYYLTKDGGHSWAGSEKVRRIADEPSHAINANELIWAFFKRFER